MERNPYAPPVSPVADPAEVRGQRPRQVDLAVRCLWGSLALSAVGLVLQPTRAATPQSQAAYMLTLIIAGIIGFGIWAWVVVKISRGRN